MFLASNELCKYLKALVSWRRGIHGACCQCAEIWSQDVSIDGDPDLSQRCRGAGIARNVPHAMVGKGPFGDPSFWFVGMSELKSVCLGDGG